MACTMHDPTVLLLLGSCTAWALLTGCAPEAPGTANATSSAGTSGAGTAGASASGTGAPGTSGAGTSGAGTSGTDTAGTSGAGTGGPGWPARAFAPFVDATSYPIVKLSQVRIEAGTRHFALGFLVAADATSCTPTWGTFYDLATGPSSWGDGMEEFLYDEIATLRQAGGDVLPSLGGAANVPLAAACATVDELVAAYRQVTEALGVSALDFDVEGTWVADTAPGGSVERRSLALAQLQAQQANAGTPLGVWFTLPVLPTGLTPDGIEVIRQAVDAGVEITGVNLMTMDYGDNAAPNPDGQMAEYAIMALTATHGQLAQVYDDAGQPRQDAALWAMLGATPMIGLNDVITERFDLVDAQELLGWAQTKSIGMLSMWSVNRDHPCPDQTSVQLDCSSTPDQTQDWAFSQIFTAYDP